MYPGTDNEIRQELDQVYRRYAPELVKRGTPLEQLIETSAKSLRESPYFEKVIVKKYPWSARYETKAYLGLLNTYSDHLRLSNQRRSELFEKIAEVIERNGGFIERPYLAVAYLAQRTSA
jgi:hypothetical protein